jgi:hypothetical protein
MSIQNVFGEKTSDEKLKLEWETLAKPVAISIQIALDSEFTEGSRTFVVYKSVQACELDVGNGTWFFRIGAWIGSETDGMIDWSGIYGPVQIASKNLPAKLAEFPTFITSVRPSYNSLFLHTGLYEPYYTIVHITQNNHFKSSGLKTYYKHDWGNGSIHIPNLDSNSVHSFQLQMFSVNKAILPKQSDVRILTEPLIVKNKKVGMPIKATSGTDHAVYAADKAILQDAVGRKKKTYSSYAEYLQFQAAKARTSARQ